MRRIVILQGHPDPGGGRFGHALADAYAAGARSAGHEVERIDIARLDFPLVRSQDEWSKGAAPAAIAGAQEAIARAQHLAIFFPLWLGDMPALLKGFFEQVMRPGFAIDASKGAAMWKKRLKGRSARVVVTMGMPAIFYRVVYRAHSVKSLERNILNFVGIAPVRTTLIGTVASKSRKAHTARLDEMSDLGRKAR